MLKGYSWISQQSVLVGWGMQGIEPELELSLNWPSSKAMSYLLVLSLQPHTSTLLNHYNFLEAER